MWGVGTVLGPIIGGAFAGSMAGWRWAFYINLPIGALITPVLIFLVPSHEPQRGMPFWKRLARIDWIGTILLSGTLVSLVVAITLGGNTFPWNNTRIIVLFFLFGFHHAIIFINNRESAHFLRIESNSPLTLPAYQRTKVVSS